MSTAADRPTTDVSVVLLDSMDRMFGQLVARLVGLDEAEYLWEPTTDCWSVRVDDDGVPIVDGADVHEIDPAPVTTIAWRLWHLAFACFDDYTRRFGGDFDEAPATWTLDPAEAVQLLTQKWQGYRAAIASRQGWDQLGPAWEHWSEHSIADMAMHASNELVHHGAEIALLRDLYRADRLA